MSDETIHVYTTGSNPTCPCGSATATNSRHCGSNFCIANGSENRKFVIGHEYGHVNLENTVPSSFNLDCSETNPGHTMTEYEYMACVMMEGWADFVSVDAWNNHNEQDGRREYLGTCRGDATVDADHTGVAPDCVVKYMEVNYTPSTEWPGHGTQLDWMRTFWDYHTNTSTSQPGSKPSHAQMQAELAASNLSHNKNMYDDYRQGIAAVSGCEQYERLVFMASANGADHCWNNCDTVSGCTNCDGTGCGQDP
jgi:hypothetical protein